VPLNDTFISMHDRKVTSLNESCFATLELYMHILLLDCNTSAIAHFVCFHYCGGQIVEISTRLEHDAACANSRLSW
jgi:hypothetical protein